MGSSDVDAIIANWDCVGDEALSIVRDGAVAADLDALEAAHGLVLPPTFRELYLRSDGTGSMDAYEIIFWPLDNIVEALAINTQPEPPARWLWFADWRLSARVFFLRFDPTRDAPTVEAYDAHPSADDELARVTHVAPSFVAWLTQYRHDPGSLRPRPR